MGFVQAGFLAALAAVAIPVIIHLVFARPRRRVDLGTLRFLKAALTAGSRTETGEAMAAVGLPHECASRCWPYCSPDPSWSICSSREQIDWPSYWLTDPGAWACKARARLARWTWPSSGRSPFSANAAPERK